MRQSKLTRSRYVVHVPSPNGSWMTPHPSLEPGPYRSAVQEGCDGWQRKPQENGGRAQTPRLPCFGGAWEKGRIV
jgi:hypothetical protein